MKISEDQIVHDAARRLAELADLPVEAGRPDESIVREVDAIFSAGPHTFLVECKYQSSPVAVSNAIDHIRRYLNQLDRPMIPLVVVPFMGETGQQMCKDAGISWLDLSGNACITAPGLRIVVVGQPNRFRYQGRPSSVFALKSSRIARWLLMHPNASVTQREIAHAVDVDEGLTSHVISRLREQGLVSKDSAGLIRLQDPALLLDAWREAYDFAKHHVMQGHIPARSGEALMNRIADAAVAHNEEYAATGLPAAWLMTHHAGFRLVTIYLRRIPTPSLQEAMGFREDPRGANTWLVTPADEGVFHGAAPQEGITCVHPVQVYLDLKAQPERAAEAAPYVRELILGKARHA